jgi:hypothetical protein
MPQNDVALWIAKLARFESEAHNIFGVIESSTSRRVTLDQSYSKLDGLSIQQDDIFRQALRCVENELYRAAHIMAWAGFVDCLHSLVASDGFLSLNSARSKWNISSIDQLSEEYTEHALVEALHAATIITKNEMKALHGMLSKRNECAHPGPYFPEYNEALGYISEIFSRMGKIEKKYNGFQL